MSPEVQMLAVLFFAVCAGMGLVCYALKLVIDLLREIRARLCDIRTLVDVNAAVIAPKVEKIATEVYQLNNPGHRYGGR